MESQAQWNPLLSFSRFIHQNCLHLATRFEHTKRLAGTLIQSHTRTKPAFAATLTSNHVVKSLAGTSVYTVSNSNNEFVLMSDLEGVKSIGLLCFRQEDAEAFLAQVCFWLICCFYFTLLISHCWFCVPCCRFVRGKRNSVAILGLFP